MKLESKRMLTGIQGLALFAAVTACPLHGSAAQEVDPLRARRVRMPPLPESAVAFSERTEVIDPVNNFYDTTVIHWDSLLQKAVVDISFHNPNETPLRIKIFLFPAEGFSYRVNPQPDGSFSCVRGVYHFPLAPWPSGGTTPLEFVGHERVLGKHLAIWRAETELTLEDHAGRQTSKGFVRSSIESRSKTAPDTMATYLVASDVTPFPDGHPDPGVFDLPSSCDSLPPP